MFLPPFRQKKLLSGLLLRRRYYSSFESLLSDLFKPDIPLDRPKDEENVLLDRITEVFDTLKQEREVFISARPNLITAKEIVTKTTLPKQPDTCTELMSRLFSPALFTEAAENDYWRMVEAEPSINYANLFGYAVTTEENKLL